jgi:predicted transposase/invertase (TIGR01784 family)
MNISKLTPEQQQRLFDTLDKYNQLRPLSQEEKEDIILRITSTEYIDLTCDWAVKHVFGHNKDHLMMLLNDFLPVTIIGIDEIHYDPNEVDRFKGDDKQVIMDILCHTETEQIIVEMQKSKSTEFRNRMAYYGASMMASQLQPGDRYGKLKPVYVICFMNFKLAHKKDQLVYRYQLREQDTNELYGNQLSLYFCELPRFVRKSRKKLTPIEEWFEILQNMATFVNRPAHVNKRFDPIFEACRQNRLDEKELEQYISAMITDEDIQSIAAAYKEEGLQEGFEKGRQEGMKEGMKEGMEKSKIHTAKSFIALGVDLDIISKATGIPMEELENLKQSCQ